MSHPVFGHSLMEDIARVQRDWNKRVAFAMEEAQRGNRDPMREILAVSVERVMERMEARARGGR